MKKFVLLGLLIFIGVAGWKVGEGLSSDATGMTVGMLLGVMAGIPTALLVLAGGWRRDDVYDGYRRGRGGRREDRYQQLPMQQPPPVIVVTGGGQGSGFAGQQPVMGYGAGAGGDWSGDQNGYGGRPERKWHIIGEDGFEDE